MSKTFKDSRSSHEMKTRASKGKKVANKNVDYSLSYGKKSKHRLSYADLAEEDQDYLSLEFFD